MYKNTILWCDRNQPRVLGQLEEAQAGIKIAGRNINTLRYADDTTLMAESEEELKSLLMKVTTELMPSNHLNLCHPLLFLPSIFPSIRVFSSESVLHIRWPSTGVSASASVLPMNNQDWFPFGLIGLISLPSKGLSRVFSNTTVQKHQFFHAQPSLWSNSHIHTWL